MLWLARWNMPVPGGTGGQLGTAGCCQHAGSRLGTALARCHRATAKQSRANREMNARPGVCRARGCSGGDSGAAAARPCPHGIWHRRCLGCRSNLRGSSACPGAAAALLSGLIHILDVQAFGCRPPAGCDSAGPCPQGAGASPATCGERDGAAPARLGPAAAPWGHGPGEIPARQEGGSVPRCPCARRAPRGQGGVRARSRPQAQLSMPSLRGAEREREKGRRGEPGGAGWLRWAQGHQWI